MGAVGGARVTTFWNAGPLKGAVRGAFRKSVGSAKKVAQARCRWKTVRSSIYFRTSGTAGKVGARDPKTTWLEKGIRAHTEAPRVKQAMKFPDGGFARGTIEHPAEPAHPFLEPAAEAWPALFKTEMRGALRR